MTRDILDLMVFLLLFELLDFVERLLVKQIHDVALASVSFRTPGLQHYRFLPVAEGKGRRHIESSYLNPRYVAAACEFKPLMPRLCDRRQIPCFCACIRHDIA